MYYWEPSRVRARECTAAGRRWRSTGPDREVEAVIRGMKLEGDWMDYVHRQAAQRHDGSAEHVMATLTAKRQRLMHVYLAGGMAEADWRRALARIDADVVELPLPVGETLLRAGRRFSEMAELYERMTPAERNQLCRLLFAAVRLDVTGKTVWLEPKPDFEGLIDARRQYVRAKVGRQFDSESAEEAIGTPDRSRTLLPSTCSIWMGDLRLAG
jgi:hypothetical protein